MYGFKKRAKTGDCIEMKTREEKQAKYCNEKAGEQEIKLKSGSLPLKARELEWISRNDISEKTPISMKAG